MRRATGELHELFDAGTRGGTAFRVRMALLDLADTLYDLVHVQRGLVAEAEVLRDAEEAREYLDARYDVSVCVCDVRYGQHLRCQEHAECRQRRPLPQEAYAQK